MKTDIGRNDPCPCGSGLKFKKCCLSNPINLFPKHMPERRWHWSQEEIREIPADKIIEKLEMCGVRFNQDEFLNIVYAVFSDYKNSSLENITIYK